MSEILPKKGDLYTWESVNIEVIRVDLMGKWADIRCSAPGGSQWTKRQHLPFPEGFKRFRDRCSTSSGQCNNGVTWIIKAADKRMASCGIHFNKVCLQMLETGAECMTVWVSDRVWSERANNAS